jgi:hypothetical protein
MGWLSRPRLLRGFRQRVPHRGTHFVIGTAFPVPMLDFTHRRGCLSQSFSLVRKLSRLSRFSYALPDSCWPAHMSSFIRRPNLYGWHGSASCLVSGVGGVTLQPSETSDVSIGLCSSTVRCSAWRLILAYPLPRKPRFPRTSSPCQCPASHRRFGSLLLIAEGGHARGCSSSSIEPCIPDMLKQLHPKQAGFVGWAYSRSYPVPTPGPPG